MRRRSANVCCDCCPSCRRVDLGGESPTEIAAAANERVNTLNVRLLRARRKLREQVERTCRACATHGCLDCDCA